MNSTIMSLASELPDTMNPTVSLYSKDDLDYWENKLTESRFTVQKILVPIMLILGAFGNSITITILTRRHMQTSTNYYLTALAASDLLYLLFTFSLSFKHDPGLTHQYFSLYWHYYRYALWIADAASSTSIWLTVAFTVERYIAVCHPIKGKIYYWFSAMIFIIIPLCLLAVFNSLLILAVKRSKKRRNTMTNSCTRENVIAQENKITVMLIAVVLMAIACQLPTAVVLIYTSWNRPAEGTVEWFRFVIMNNYFNWFIAVNASANFMFYCALSDRYRKTFMRTLCRKCYKWQSPTPSWVGQTTAYSNFEDGSSKVSFRNFIRTASLRISRRSSSTIKTSNLSTPRASPSGSCTRASERRFHDSVYLSVPQRSRNSRLRQNDTLDEIGMKHLIGNKRNSEGGISPISINGNSQYCVPEETFEEIEMSSQSPSPDLVIENTKILADTEIVPQTLATMEKNKEESNGKPIRNLFKLFRYGNKAKDDKNKETENKQHSILIRCQLPSEEQTAV